MARRYPILAGLCASEHSPNPVRWADPTTQHPCSRMDITLACTAKKTEHTGAKHRKGTYWGPKRDAKLESHRLRRCQGKCLLRHEEQLPAQSQGDKLRPALPASAGGWKALIDAEELSKKTATNRVVSTRPVPTGDCSDADRPPALRVLQEWGIPTSVRCACLSFVTISSLNNIPRILYGFMLCCMTPR